jgi:hypothetical protein
MGPVQYAHWHHFFEDVPVSSAHFYKSLEENLTTKKVPEIAISQVDKLEGGPVSPKRTYLELKRDWLTYHVCVAPFGTGFFVSSRLLVWPFGSWRMIAALGGALLFFLFILFVAVSGSMNAGIETFEKLLAQMVKSR